MQIRRLFLAILIMPFSLSVAHAQGAADMFRSLTGALKGVQGEPQKEKPATATMGVRGIDEVENKSGKSVAPASSGDNALMEGWAATKSAASHAAAKKGLAARQVTLNN